MLEEKQEEIMLKMLVRICLVLLTISLLAVDCQVTKGCGQEYGCFIYPNKCSDTECSFIFKWSLNDNSTNKFVITAFIGNQLPSDACYLAIGFSHDQQMVGRSL